MGNAFFGELQVKSFASFGVEDLAHVSDLSLEFTEFLFSSTDCVGSLGCLSNEGINFVFQISVLQHAFYLVG